MYKKKTANKKVYKRKSYKPRYQKKARKQRLNQNTVYTISRWVPQTELYIPTNQVTASYSYSFNAAQVVNFSDFTTLFDQFKIKAVLMEFRLMTNPDATIQPTNQVSTSPPYLFPTLWTVIDRDDDGTITLDQMRQHQGARRSVLRPNAIIKRYIPYPSTLGMTYKSGVSTAYTINRSKWVDVTDSATPHYGVKTVLDTEGLANAGNYTVRLDMKFIIAFKGVL